MCEMFSLDNMWRVLFCDIPEPLTLGLGNFGLPGGSDVITAPGALTHCGLVINQVNIGSGDGLVPDSTRS